jgi:hypothetical protein
MPTTVAETTHLDNLLEEVFGLRAHRAARQAWREAVATVSAKAKAHLPEAQGRVEKAEQLVLRNGSKIIPLFTFTEALPSSSILGGPCQKRSACSF